MPDTRSLPTPRLKLHKIGSDPEALFMNRTNGTLVPATTFVGGHGRGLRSWIGTDGCSSTAELRPRPARDVRLHLRDIAEAMTVIDRTVCQKNPDIVLLAQPYGLGSPCGGHIHTSFVLHDPIAAPMLLAGQVWNVAGTSSRGFGGPYSMHANLSISVDQRYREAARDGRAFGFNQFARRMFLVIGPLESGLYPEDVRLNRNYGSNEDAVRAEFAATAVSPGVVKWRLEYRYPSTWLGHPAQAMLYLSAAKLMVNNYHNFEAALARLDGPPPRLRQLPDWLDEFLAHPDTIVTDDVKHLGKIARFVLNEVHPRLQLPLVEVDFPAWARFLSEGRFK